MCVCVCESAHACLYVETIKKLNKQLEASILYYFDNKICIYIHLFII